MHILVFPVGCKKYKGPHSVNCYKTIWLESGCIRRGLGWPDDLTLKEITFLNQFNIRLVLQ